MSNIAAVPGTASGAAKGTCKSVNFGKNNLEVRAVGMAARSKLWASLQ